MTYEKAINKVKTYINTLLKTKESLNPYTDNKFLAQVIAEVIALLEFERDYSPSLLKRENISILEKFPEYFNKDLTIHQTYKKLQEKADIFRNLAILICIHHGSEWTTYRNMKGTQFNKILRKIYRK